MTAYEILNLQPHGELLGTGMRLLQGTLDSYGELVLNGAFAP
jgi:hypothetical protein